MMWLFTAGLLWILECITTNLQAPRVEENEILHIHDIVTLEKYSTLANVKKTDDAIILRSSSGEGSLINIKNESISDNWSTVFTVKNLILKDVETAGIYFWYVDKPLEKGAYKGGAPIFKGFLTGIEFAKERVDIVFAFNYGANFENKELQTTNFDRINPSLIDHLDEFKIKIIHTEKNFKIEIYDLMGNLLSDSFRIHEPLIMNRDIKEKKFAITTKYEHCPNDVFLEMKDLKINSRKELPEYDMRDLHTEFNQYPRSKSEDELRVSIAELDHFLSYVTIALGTKDHNNINEMALSIKKKLRLLKISLDSTLGLVNEHLSDESSSRQATLLAKFSDLENIASTLTEKTVQIGKKLKKLTEESGRYTTSMAVWFLLMGMVFFVGSALKIVGERIFLRKVLSRKEK